MKLDEKTKKKMKKNALEASLFLKSLANKHRLLILCELAEGPKTVTQLIAATGIAQTSMSQHLNKLKEKEVVTFTRQHRILTYKIADQNTFKIMKTLHDAYCK